MLPKVLTNSNKKKSDDFCQKIKRMLQKIWTNFTKNVNKIHQKDLTHFAKNFDKLYQKF